MNGWLMLAILTFVIGIPVMCIVVWVSTSQAKNKNFYAAYNGLKQALSAAQDKYHQNSEYLNRIGFHSDRESHVGNRHFSFDNSKGLTACSVYYFDEKFLGFTPRDYKTNSYEVLRLFSYPKSYCGELTVFPYNKIVECVLIQDGSVVKSSEGSAILAGTSVPMLGVLQGKASAASNEHQTGLLSVRLTLDDIQTPSVMFHFTDGNVDKSSAAYAAAFQNAQEVFGIFDAIVRMNQKATTPRTASAHAAAHALQAVPVQPVAASAPAQNANESVFEKIRQLGKLRDDGLLTEEEFTQKKKLLMEQIQ